MINRTNRFSGIDRIGDGNQLTYALTTRFLVDDSGMEKIRASIGQIRYFANRKVQLCYTPNGTCTDTQVFLGFLSPVAKSSPIATELTYRVNWAWHVTAGYVWDPYFKETNNANFNFHYEPLPNHLLNFGYTYLVNGDITQVAFLGTENDALNQANMSFAWPINDYWSAIGAYGYNISKNYNMMAFLGLQYDTCCWAFRVAGGQTFRSLRPTSFEPRYTNNIYFQVLLKGLGSVANSDPNTVIRSFLPHYRDIFHT